MKNSISYAERELSGKKIQQNNSFIIVTKKMSMEEVKGL